MATFYPDEYPGEKDDNDPEYQVFEILRALPDNYTVFYSKRIVGARNARAECEIDFVIFDGHKSLIALEVKGGLIEYDGAVSGWSQNSNSMDGDPNVQAQSACHTLISYLGQSAAPINSGWALAFPDCVSLPHMSTAAEVPADLIIDQRDLLDPVAAIRTVEAYWEGQFNKPGISEASAQGLLTQLNRTLGFVTRVGVRLRGDEQALIRVTNEQLEVLHDLDDNPRMIIRGGAGTGKTLIAQEFAKRQAEADNKVLLLFYNRCIANTVRYGLGRDSPIECSTFHSLAKRIITDADPSWWENNSSKEQSFWNDTVPLKLIDCEIAPSEQYDTIIIDEGQDFKPDWFETLEKILKDKDSGRFVVFYDENQNVFGRWDDVPWGSTGVTRKRLTKNCRNTRNIIAHLNETMGAELQPFERSPTGEPVVRALAQNND
ncbi:AAA family ATPase, partial [Myxococcota bacterium]|nr:AAA family ATPase [Myxococcota bacterium]